MQCAATLVGPQLSDPEHQALADFNDLAKLPPTEKKTNPTKPCSICTKNKVRKDIILFFRKEDLNCETMGKKLKKTTKNSTMSYLVPLCILKMYMFYVKSRTPH